MGWYNLGPGYITTPQMSSSKPCGTSNQSIDVTTTITGLPTGYIPNAAKYRSIVNAKE